MSFTKNKSHPLLRLTHFSLLVHNFNKICERQYGISLVQWCALKHLIDLPGISAHGLAKSIGIHQSSLTPTLRRLERKHFIYIDRDHQDARKKVLSITRLGKDKLEFIENTLKVELTAFTEVEIELKCLKDIILKFQQRSSRKHLVLSEKHIFLKNRYES